MECEEFSSESEKRRKKIGRLGENLKQMTLHCVWLMQSVIDNEFHDVSQSHIQQHSIRFDSIQTYYSTLFFYAEFDESFEVHFWSFRSVIYRFGYGSFRISNVV